ncbi:NUDIX domain-containing protein [Corynebacterium sp. HS2168-gen11]|uniref:NUDIX domain-containing protein n=1 Tax=Corynebacterium sp. HS2168-gen11 TaxID=2974027 RepID=UPI00216B4013|nr:NUDIX domain-containing protein [Corynebacterium sp. HS2168-gen11]MCS4535475.1 NUDIX domain-containing protein [Corynebacterium sp. HS2168-gen11]
MTENSRTPARSQDEQPPRETGQRRRRNRNRRETHTPPPATTSSSAASSPAASPRERNSHAPNPSMLANKRPAAKRPHNDSQGPAPANARSAGNVARPGSASTSSTESAGRSGSTNTGHSTHASTHRPTPATLERPTPTGTAATSGRRPIPGNATPGSQHHATPGPANQHRATPASVSQKGSQHRAKPGPAHGKDTTGSQPRPVPTPKPAAHTSSRRERFTETRGTKQRPRVTPRTTARRGPRPKFVPESRMPVTSELSAGGLVVSGLAEAVQPDGSVDLSRIYVALIGRTDRRQRLLWSMPKGHVEPHEDIAATAEREVWEETGIRGEVFAKLGVIDYWFVSEGTRIHKTVHHHLLRYVDGTLNDEDPEVTEVAWIPANALMEHFAYADERKLARIAHDLLPIYAKKELAEGRITPR